MPALGEREGGGWDCAARAEAARERRQLGHQRASVDDGLKPYVSAQRGSNKH